VGEEKEIEQHQQYVTDYSFWAKTTDTGEPGISVYQHLINVGRVAQCLAETSPKLLSLFNLRTEEIGALSALHDLGKLSPGFERKSEKWLEENGLTKLDVNHGWKSIMEGNHGKVSHAVIQQYLNSIGVPRQTASFLACLLGAHHGRLTLPDERGYMPQKAITENYSGILWEQERQNTAERVWNVFGADKTKLEFSEDSPAYWWLAGLTTIADWIGSDEEFFPPEKESPEFDAASVAEKCITAIGLQRPMIRTGLSFSDIFSFVPNDMQKKALSVITRPGVYVIEAPMGMGKTEAALGAAYQLLASGHARGIYFALPTQATSNRIHLRMESFIEKISPDSPSTKLIHGNSWLLSSDGDTAEKIGECHGRNWFASAKKALVAPFGVGTVDQALLGVVAAKHFFVRHFALAGKVVILDEVHSYDCYTGTLIDTLIQALERLGCTVIILSATLTAGRRSELLCLYNTAEEIEPEKIPYPQISGFCEGAEIDPVAPEPPPSRTVNIWFIDSSDAENKTSVLAKKGGSVLWICDTVDNAQKEYQRLKSLCDGDVKIGLLHSRFPFQRRETLENEWMERLGKDSTTRCGCILVSTQIVEQSVDLDADLMITELAPTDMLLQRMGRLWRHNRSGRPSAEPEFCILKETDSVDEFKTLDAEAIKSALGSKAYVYAPYVLLRTLDLWDSLKSIDIPDGIRSCLESTYKEQEDEPESWIALNDEWFGKNYAEKDSADMASNLWNVQLHDEEGIQTRLNENPTVSLVLCSTRNKNRLSFPDGSTVAVIKDRFSIKTARAISKNIVKIPRYCFNGKDTSVSDELLAGYVYGENAIGVMAADRAVEAAGISKKYILTYTDELGLVIEKPECK
jgi:CRISPR-associated endonuclease/helicase Cas3